MNRLLRRRATASRPVYDVTVAMVLGSSPDLTALHQLAEGAEVLTFGHELIPQAHLLELSRLGVRLAPRPGLSR